MENEHKALVERLFKKKDPSADLMHAAIGLSGEVGELLEAHDLMNVIEEVGDCYFYLEAYWQQLDATPSSFNVTVRPLPLALLLPQLAIEAAALLDVTKKNWVYTRPLDVTLAGTLLSKLRYRLACVSSLFGFAPNEALRQNIEKLNARYPDQRYTDHHAQARLDKEKQNG